MEATQNTDTLTVPKVESNTTPEAKPSKRQRTAKRAEAKMQLAVTQAVAQWAHGSAPTGLHDKTMTVAIGQATGRKSTKDGSPLTSSSMVVLTPTASKLRSNDGKLSIEESQQLERDIAMQNKPLLAGRVAAAIASPRWIIRRYQETPNRKGKHSLAVRFEHFHTESEFERMARVLKVPVAEVYKRLGVKPPADLEITV